MPLGSGNREQIHLQQHQRQPQREEPGWPGDMEFWQQRQAAQKRLQEERERQAKQEAAWWRFVREHTRSGDDQEGRGVGRVTPSVSPLVPSAPREVIVEALLPALDCKCI